MKQFFIMLIFLCGLSMACGEIYPVVPTPAVFPTSTSAPIKNTAVVAPTATIEPVEINITPTVSSTRHLVTATPPNDGSLNTATPVVNQSSALPLVISRSEIIGIENNAKALRVCLQNHNDNLIATGGVNRPIFVNTTLYAKDNRELTVIYAKMPLILPKSEWCSIEDNDHSYDFSNFGNTDHLKSTVDTPLFVKSPYPAAPAFGFDPFNVNNDRLQGVIHSLTNQNSSALDINVILYDTSGRFIHQATFIVSEDNPNTNFKPGGEEVLQENLFTRGRTVGHIDAY